MLATPPKTSDMLPHSPAGRAAARRWSTWADLEREAFDHCRPRRDQRIERRAAFRGDALGLLARRGGLAGFRGDGPQALRRLFAQPLGTFRLARGGEFGCLGEEPLDARDGALDRAGQRFRQGRVSTGRSRKRVERAAELLERGHAAGACALVALIAARAGVAVVAGESGRLERAGRRAAAVSAARARVARLTLVQGAVA